MHLFSTFLLRSALFRSSFSSSALVFGISSKSLWISRYCNFEECRTELHKQCFTTWCSLVRHVRRLSASKIDASSPAPCFQLTCFYLLLLCFLSLSAHFRPTSVCFLLSSAITWSTTICSLSILFASAVRTSLISLVGVMTTICIMSILSNPVSLFVAILLILKVRIKEYSCWIRVDCRYCPECGLLNQSLSRSVNASFLGSTCMFSFSPLFTSSPSGTSSASLIQFVGPFLSCCFFDCILFSYFHIHFLRIISPSSFSFRILATLQLKPGGNDTWKVIVPQEENRENLFDCLSLHLLIIFVLHSRFCLFSSYSVFCRC